MHKSTSLLYGTFLFLYLLLAGCTDSLSTVDDTTIPEVKNIEDPTDSLNECDYLVITPDQLYEAAAKLVDYRNTNPNDDVFDGAVLKMSKIEWYMTSAGYDKVKLVIAWLSQYAWNKKAKYVVLLGSDNLDDPSALSIPSIDTSVSKFGDNYYITKYYSDTLLPVAFGRIPVYNLEDALNYVEKVKMFEETFKQSILGIADDKWQASGKDFINHQHICESVLSLIDSTDYNIHKINMRNYSPNNDSMPLTSDEIENIKTDLIDKINLYNQCLFLAGNTNATAWTEEYILNGKDVENIEKIQSISIFSSIGCRFTDCTPKASLCRQLINFKKKGAVAFVGSPVTAFATQGEKFFSKFWELAAKEDCVSLGNAMQNTFSFTGNPNYAFIGDPALDIN